MGGPISLALDHTEALMKYINKDEARKLAIENHKIMAFFKAGYSEALHLTNDKVMNDKLVKPNDYFVNDDFESNPIWFVAHYSDRIYRVLRVIFVHPDHRCKGIGAGIIRSLQDSKFTEKFLQLGVQTTPIERFEKLNALYSRLGFKRNPIAIDHGGGHQFHDYFWAPRAFGVQQQGTTISAYLM